MGAGGASKPRDRHQGVQVSETDTDERRRLGVKVDLVGRKEVNGGSPAPLCGARPIEAGGLCLTCVLCRGHVGKTGGTLELG